MVHKIILAPTQYTNYILSYKCNVLHYTNVKYVQNPILFRLFFYSPFSNIMGQFYRFSKKGQTMAKGTNCYITYRNEGLEENVLGNYEWACHEEPIKPY